MVKKGDGGVVPFPAVYHSFLHPIQPNFRQEKNTVFFASFPPPSHCTLLSFFCFACNECLGMVRGAVKSQDKGEGIGRLWGGCLFCPFFCSKLNHSILFTHSPRSTRWFVFSKKNGDGYVPFLSPSPRDVFALSPPCDAMYSKPWGGGSACAQEGKLAAWEEAVSCSSSCSIM